MKLHLKSKNGSLKNGFQITIIFKTSIMSIAIHHGVRKSSKFKTSSFHHAKYNFGQLTEKTVQYTGISSLCTRNYKIHSKMCIFNSKHV